MWPAHVVTLARLPLALGIPYAHGIWAVVLVGLAALSDAVDGRLARWLRSRGKSSPDIGGWLDPVVDKLFVAIACVVLVDRAPPATLLLLVTRELLLVPVGVLYLVRRIRLRELSADRLGKLATVAQLIALAIVLGSPEHGLIPAALAGALGAAAAIHYAWRSERMHSVTRPAAQREMSITASSAP